MTTPNHFYRIAFITILLVCSASFADAPEKPLFHRVPGNLLQNSSFEQNWFNHDLSNRKRFLLLQASDMGVAECDGNVDYWTMRGKAIAWDTSIARTGSRSLRFDGAGSASQMVRFAGENSPKGGGAFYAYFMPLEKRLALQVLRRTITVGAWCRTKDVLKGAEPKLTVKVDCGARLRLKDFTPVPVFGKKTVARSAAAAGGTHDWQYVEVKVEAADLEAAPWFATVTLSSGGKGTVWFDDISCVETPTTGIASRPPQIDGNGGDQATSAELVNRLPNGNFASLDQSGWAAGWKKPALWTWFRNDYYTFTGWSHSESIAVRGSAVVDHMLSSTGNASLRMIALPGDNFAVESEPILLNQDSARPIEVRAMVKADNLRTLEIMARDEHGHWLRQGDFLGDAMQEPGAYNMASTGAGTYDWICVHKFFSPDHPLQSMTLALAVRGFDGQIVADKNVVGTVWIDDVQVFEHGIDKAKIAPASIPAAATPAPAAYSFQVIDIDLGDRLWGKNAATLTVEFHGRDTDALKNISLHVTTTDPSGASKTSIGNVPIVRQPAEPDAIGIATIRAEYLVSTLCKNWKEQYKLTLQLFAGDKPVQPASEFFFGTPSTLMTMGVSGYYMYADEKPFAHATLNIARDSLSELARCQMIVRTAGKEKTVLDLTQFSEIHEPHTAPAYIDTRNMVQAEIGSEGFVVHPWTDPQRDNEIKMRLFSKEAGAEKLLAESAPVSFGFLEKLPPSVPEKIERTAVNEKGFITINGKPYFPVCWRPHGDTKTPEANYPVQAIGYKALDLTKIICSKNAAPDGEVKKDLLAKIEQVKNDPALFQYEVGDGEMQLQGKGWVDRAQWCKTAIGWIREADPNHIINGSYSWLVGHPGHDETMKTFAGVWDVIGVESSFESRVLTNEVAVPLMKERKSVVIVGLETYFYQPLDVLRWRGYMAVLDGAHGIGLCPSGMMESKPDSVNFLRGLNAEFRSLAPAIMADEPAQKCSVDGKSIDLMERSLDGKRYLIAVPKQGGTGAVTARITFPAGFSPASVKAMFEGRVIQPANGGFSDKFATPYSVHVYEMQ